MYSHPFVVTIAFISLKVEIKSTVACSTSFTRSVINYKKLDLDKVNALIAQSDLENLVNTLSIDDAAEHLSQKIMSLVATCAPCKTIKVSDRDPPWVNEEIKRLLTVKNKAHTRAKNTNSTVDWANFRKIRNDYTTAIRKRKTDYDNDLDFKISNTSTYTEKEWWKTVRAFMNKNNAKSSTIPPLENNDILIYSPAEKAELFNTFFCSQSVVDDDDDTIPFVESSNNQIPPLNISTNYVENILTSLDTNKAVGPDLIHNKVLKSCASTLTRPLTILFNRSLSEGKFPQIWKNAQVTPIFKKGNQQKVNNYRPISLLSCIGKVLEICVQKHVLTYLIENDIISQHQSGFLPHHSTIYQLLNIYDDIGSSLDNNTITQAVFFDISKAFDKVWHRGLIAKLQAAGIRGNLLSWFKDYLSNRKQSVVISGQKSSYQPIKAGVPQGSVLGPTLFLVFINDIVRNLKATVKLFADDTSLYLCLDNTQERANIINSDLNKIADWSKSWKVTFNPAKTELINFTRKRNPTYEPLSFLGETLQPLDSHKHLGVSFQKDGKWDTQILYILSKCRLLVAVLKSFKYRLSRKALERMYTSFILPHFDYGDVLYDNCTENQADQLENLHLDALRTIIGTVRGTSHNLIYQESGFCSLRERRKRHKLILFYKIMNNLTPPFLTNLLPPLASDLNPYHRRRPLDRRPPRCKTELYAASFFPSTTVMWNELPDDMKICTSLSKFKRYIKRSDSTVPPYYYTGARLPQVILTRLRVGMSDLKSHLVTRHILANPRCECGFISETSHHYLLECPKFEQARNATISKLPTHLKNSNILLRGDRSLSITSNLSILNETLNFIILSERFF